MKRMLRVLLLQGASLPTSGKFSEARASASRSYFVQNSRSKNDVSTKTKNLSILRSIVCSAIVFRLFILFDSNLGGSSTGCGRSCFNGVMQVALGSD